MANATYLAQHKLDGTPIICNIQSLSDCNIVASSSYSQLFGIPLAVYGVIFFAILFVLAALELLIFNRILRRAIQVIALFGVIAQIGFTLIQIYFINALCVYCIASALIAFLILVFASIIEPVRRGMFSPSHPSREATAGTAPKVAESTVIVRTLPMPPV